MKSRTKHKYVSNLNMEWIDDKTLFKAVMFARKMIREGTHPTTANFRAAEYYEVAVSDVAHYVGQAASLTRLKRGK
jgi:hypothetical protein